MYTCAYNITETIRALSRSVPFWKDVPVVLLNQSIIISARLLADLSTAKIASGLMLSKKRFVDVLMTRTCSQPKLSLFCPFYGIYQSINSS